VRFRGRSRCNCGAAAEYAALRCNVHRANEREIARRTGVTRERRGRGARRGRVPDFANGRTPRRLGSSRAKRGLANSADLGENPGEACIAKDRVRGDLPDSRAGGKRGEGPSRRAVSRRNFNYAFPRPHRGKFAFN
jgi:hypothetical protein